jgi:predicted alpha/beta hydrolase family esterase
MPSKDRTIPTQRRSHRLLPAEGAGQPHIRREHRAGRALRWAALLLAVLEHIDARVDQAILVAGYCTQPNDEDEPVLQDSYDWAAIRASVRDLYFINSRNDPYGCTDAQGRIMFEQLGGTQIVRNDGHFGDIDQPYASFELLDRLIG